MVGLGGWGKNLLRNFGSLPRRSCATPATPARDRASTYAPAHPRTDLHRRLPGAAGRPDAGRGGACHAGADHFEMARPAIAAGKHVMVEKPMTWRAAEAPSCARWYTTREGADGRPPAAVPSRRREAARADRFGRAGEIRYVYGNRVNLGVRSASRRTCCGRWACTTSRWCCI